jgi:hypothetical protein
MATRALLQLGRPSVAFMTTPHRSMRPVATNHLSFRTLHLRHQSSTEYRQSTAVPQK